MPSLNIAIIGAGPAGATLAHLLLKSEHDISVSIFEREPSLDARGQGGTLDLHTETGLLALKQAGLYNEFLKYARFDGEAIVLADKHVKRYINISGGSLENSNGRPEIDRKALREILLDSLPKDTVKWGHKLQNIDMTNSSTDPKDIVLEFEHTSMSGFDLIVGADGAYSRLRPLLSDVKPFFSGVGCVRLNIDNAEKAVPKIHTCVNRGSFFAYSDNKGLIAQQMGDGTISISAMLTKASPDWIKQFPWNGSDIEAIKSQLLSEFANWDSQYKKWIEACDISPWISNLDMLPVGHKWTHRSGVTLVGDAAHLATPFAGEGVNLGMADAMYLANAITKTASRASPAPTVSISTILSSNVKAFEEDMFVRATRMQSMTYNMMRLMLFEQDAPNKTVESWLCWVAGSDYSSVVAPFIYAGIYAYFAYFRLWHKFWSKA
ncbi:putative oligopeptide transporter [Aureobasidium subglaciale]|nr:putative oligopeptide transporter [Aureobasidium subglaciale]